MYLSKTSVTQDVSSKARLRQLDVGQFSLWDHFVETHPDGTFFHLSGWKGIYENIFHLNTYYLYVEEGNEVTGVLPLVHVKSRLFANALVSTPFCVYGGILANTPKAYSLLLQESKKIGHALNVDHIEFRQKKSIVEEGFEDTLYVNFEQALDQNPEQNLKKIPRKQRAMVRKAIKQDLRFQIEQDVRNFYPLYSESVRNLGTPVHRKSFYQVLLDTFPSNSDILTVYHGKEAISSVLNFYYKDTVLPYYGGGGMKARSLASNDFMYWSLMNHALEKGKCHFNFGRSKVDSGSYRFKKHWGFEPVPLKYRYIPINKQSMPNVNPNNPKYRFFIQRWQQLPLWMANWLGPKIAGRIA